MYKWAHQILTARQRLIKALQDAKVGLLLGTSSRPVARPSVHRELELLVEAGLTPYQALATGTRNVAAFLGTLDSTGTIAVGKRADLALLGGNPLKDIHHTAAYVGLMVGGRWLSRKALDAAGGLAP
jgi:imidazolonepropionase-like amidohydrolase